jgi:hypothetical protein
MISDASVAYIGLMSAARQHDRHQLYVKFYGTSVLLMFSMSPPLSERRGADGIDARA